MDFSGLSALVGEENISLNVPMASLTTFKIGGPADATVRPQDVEQLKEVTEWCREKGLPWILLGKGSNILVSDEGFRGVVICPEGDFLSIHTEGYQIHVGCGVTLARAAKEALDHGLTGLEFAAGIPGSLGGAVYMNAGAYGGEMSQVLGSICYLDGSGIRHIGPEEARFTYRGSRFMQEKSLVLGAVICLKPGDAGQIQERMRDLAGRRREKQPLEYPSAGSMFKRPEGYFAGKLIQDAGLAGFSVGGARVSEKHCGFVINTGSATARDVRALVQAVHNKVWESFGVRIWPEVRYLGHKGWEPMLASEGEVCATLS